MIKGKRAIIISWTAVLLWMLLVFSLSAQPAVQSSGFSRNVTKVIVEIVGKIIPLDIESSTITDLVTKYENTVRKFAHGGVYFVLGILVMNAVLRSSVRGFNALAFTFAICVLYAVSDEVHQLFVLGRSGQIKDILIDSTGAVIGIALYEMTSRIKKKVIISRL